MSESTLQRDLNRVKETCKRLDRINKLRKFQIAQYDLFVKKLLKEKRITVNEVSEFIKNKKDL
jgi:hypothetical protein